MLTIGRSNYMRFNHPAEAKLMKSILPNSRISVAPINFEDENNHSPKFIKKPPLIPRKSPKESQFGYPEEELPSSIMTKVSKFEYLAAQNLKTSISPKVFSSNLVTVNIPARNVLGKVPPQFQNLSKNLPQSTLNYSELNYNKKQENKIPDGHLFRNKPPQYVNISINEQKTINNRIILYENDCSLKSQNTNELNNVNIRNNTVAQVNKNVNCVQVPSLNYNRNPTFFNSPSLIENKDNLSEFDDGILLCRTGGVLSEGADFPKNEAELRRNQVSIEFVQVLFKNFI